MPTPALRELLIQLRAPIFNTLPVTSNARAGAKYLRRKLRGPAITSYFNPLQKMRPLNYPHETNKYAGWQGEGIYSNPDAIDPLHKTIISKHQLAQPVADGWREVTRRNKPGLSRTGQSQNPAGWIEVAGEYVRFKDLFGLKRRGKGRPKKGMGKKAELAKGKKK